MDTQNIIFALNVLFLIGECIHSLYLKVPPYGGIFVALTYLSIGYLTGDYPGTCFKHDAMENFSQLNHETMLPSEVWVCCRSYLSGLFSNMAFYTLIVNAFIEDRRKKNLTKQQELKKETDEKV